MNKFLMTTKTFRHKWLSHRTMMFYFRPGGDLPLAYLYRDEDLYYTSEDHFHNGVNHHLVPFLTIYTAWNDAILHPEDWILAEESQVPLPGLQIPGAKTDLSPGAIVTAKDNSWELGKIVEVNEHQSRFRVKWENTYWKSDGSIKQTGKRTWFKRDRLILLG